MEPTRRKKKVVAPSYTGITLEQWHAQTENITWAQLDPKFREICCVVLNESQLIPLTAHGCSGERAFGRIEGYQRALDVLLSMAKKPEKVEPQLEPTFEKDPTVPTETLRD